MKIHVEMTSEEFQEFMQWKKEKGIYDVELSEVDGKMEYINNKILWALKVDEKKPGKVKIIDQEHAAELVEMAHEWFC